MKVVGLVGQSGSGKSTIAVHIRGKGAGHVDADRVAHEVLTNDTAVRRKLRERFGGAVFSNGMVDRKQLSKLVFGDAEALRALNAITHPAIIAVCEQRLAAYRAASVPLVVVDAALLLEVPMPFQFDLVIALRCSREELERRLRGKGLDERDIRTRLASQEHIPRSFDRADVVLDTARPLAEVLKEIDKLIDPLLH